ncbi:hypothetical protein [Geodermatophilus sp. SYSU D00684]
MDGPRAAHRDRPWPSWLLTVLVAAAVASGTVVALDDRRGAGEMPAAKGTSVVDTGWRPLSVSTEWLVTGDGARYRVVDGICYLQVHVRDVDGQWEPNSLVATLPTGTAPAWHMGFVATRDGLPFSEFKVFTNGQVLMVAPGDGRDGRLTASASFPVGS